MLFSLQRAQSVSTSSVGDGAAISTITLVVYVGIIVLTLAGYWRMLSKAGRPGWAVIVPIYGAVQLLQLSGRSGWWVLAMMVPFLNLFTAIRLAFELARVFGRGIGFGFGLLFLPFIFAPVLGFGDAEYVGRRTRDEVRSPVLAGA
jgi:uncharacterized membrane protein YhaH (DUF805 family)